MSSERMGEAIANRIVIIVFGSSDAAINHSNCAFIIRTTGRRQWFAVRVIITVRTLEMLLMAVYTAKTNLLGGCLRMLAARWACGSFSSCYLTGRDARSSSSCLSPDEIWSSMAYLICMQPALRMMSVRPTFKSCRRVVHHNVHSIILRCSPCIAVQIVSLVELHKPHFFSKNSPVIFCHPSACYHTFFFPGRFTT